MTWADPIAPLLITMVEPLLMTMALIGAPIIILGCLCSAFIRVGKNEKEPSFGMNEEDKP